MNGDQLSLWDLLAEPDAETQPEASAVEPGQLELPPQVPVQLMPAPAGTATERLLRVMALRKQESPEAIGEMVAALCDEDGNVRYLAALSLQGIGGDTVIATLKAFIDQAPPAVPQGCDASARGEAEKLLGKLTE